MIAQQENTDNNRTVIVAGAHGVAGRAALEHYATLPGTVVYGLSRRSAPRSGKIHHISVDLLNPDDIQAKLGHLSAATHLVFGAYIEKPTAAEKTAVNVEILRNLLDVLEKTAPALKHIILYQGGKAYGADLGPFKTPAREDDPRLMPPNFYYDQEDLLRARQRGKNWHFTVLRPERTGSPVALSWNHKSLSSSLPDHFRRDTRSRHRVDRRESSSAERDLQYYERGLLPLAVHVAAYRKDVRDGCS
jgi:nucleoside-diphosphate-sugar epimerase